MVDVAASVFNTRRDRAADGVHTTGASTALSALLIIGFPTLFWMSLLEAANYVLALELSAEMRLAVAAVLVSLLGAIWGFIIVSGRQQKSRALSARLEKPDR